MERQTAVLLLGLGGAAALAVWYFRNRESGESGDVLEEIALTAQKVTEDVVVAAKEVAGAGGWPYPRGQEYAGLFRAAESKYGIPQDMLVKQAWQESRFRQDIITGVTRSSAGAVGIMQIIPRWHPEVGEAGALNPAVAIPYAAKYVAALRKQFGTWELAFAAYNWGPGNVQKKLSGQASSWPSETFAYVKNITGSALA